MKTAWKNNVYGEIRFLKASGVTIRDQKRGKSIIKGLQSCLMLGVDYSMPYLSLERQTILTYWKDWRKFYSIGSFELRTVSQ
jgi:hypothetical protein